MGRIVLNNCPRKLGAQLAILQKTTTPIDPSLYEMEKTRKKQLTAKYRKLMKAKANKSKQVTNTSRDQHSQVAIIIQLVLNVHHQYGCGHLHVNVCSLGSFKREMLTETSIKTIFSVTQSFRMIFLNKYVYNCRKSLKKTCIS